MCIGHTVTVKPYWKTAQRLELTVMFYCFALSVGGVNCVGSVCGIGADCLNCRCGVCSESLLV